jgi:hypothetical protein
VARAICIADGEDPDTPVLCAINAYRDYVFQWTLYIPEARASIAIQRELIQQLRDALKKVLDTREREAKAMLAWSNAQNNFGVCRHERMARAKAMDAACDAEREARVLLLTLRDAGTTGEQG